MCLRSRHRIRQNQPGYRNVDAQPLQHKRRPQATQEQAEALIRLCSEQGFAILAVGRIWRGWALAEQGQEEGIGQMQQGITAFRATGTFVIHQKAHPTARQLERAARRKCPSRVSSRVFLWFDHGPDRWQLGDHVVICYSRTRR